MPDYDDTNKGVLFFNDRKSKSTDRDLSGNVTVQCSCGQKTDYWLSSWINKKETVTKGKYLSLSLTPKDEERPQTADFDDDLDDDVPF